MPVKHPARAQDQMRGRGPQHRLFAGEFAGGVMVQGIGGVAFGVGRFLGAVENVVGAVVNEPDVLFSAEFGEFLRRRGVDRPGQVALNFAALHQIIRRGVDDHLRLPFGQPFRHQVRVGQVKLRMAGK